jgi:serine/threonine protein kinase
MPQAPATLVRPSPSEGDSTTLRPPTVARPDDSTAQRSSTAAEPDDSTTLRAPATLRSSDSTTLRAPATARSAAASSTTSGSASDPDATARLPQAQETAVRTLHADPRHTETLQASATHAERTHFLQNRLARSLEEAGEGHRGPLEIGTVLKQRFVLETQLGRGGMGLVFGAIDRRKEEARDPNPRVALKVLNADFQGHPQSFIALQREARKAQTLAHPNVVTVFDFDRDGEAVYMTMELLQGRTLDAMTREARGHGIGREQALPIIRGIAEGLAYAHRKGIVHSDLKPGNVFITEDGTPKILDFGIARAVPSSVAEENKDVFDAGSLGAYTEAYATDEMVDGRDPHPADDMYALGLIAYELLTGFHPYQRHSAPNARKLGIQPAAIKGLRRTEAHAIERCLSFDRTQRPRDAAEFLKAFRGVTRLQKATAAAAAVLAVTAGYLWYQNYLETSPARPFSELPLEAQQTFRRYMDDGNAAWVFFERDGITGALNDAIDLYSRAYDLHPRNREAVAALDKAADALLKETRGDLEQRRELARNLLLQSAHYRNYAPVVEAAK